MPKFLNHILKHDDMQTLNSFTTWRERNSCSEMIMRWERKRLLGMKYQNASKNRKKIRRKSPSPARRCIRPLRCRWRCRHTRPTQFHRSCNRFSSNRSIHGLPRSRACINSVSLINARSGQARHSQFHTLCAGNSGLNPKAEFQNPIHENRSKWGLRYLSASTPVTFTRRCRFHCNCASSVNPHCCCCMLR